MDLAEADMVLLAQPFMMLRNVHKMELRLGGITDEQGWSLHPDLDSYKTSLESVVMSKEPATETDIHQVQELSHRVLEKMPPPDRSFDKQWGLGYPPDTWEYGWDCRGRLDGKLWALRSNIVKCGLPSCHDGHALNTYIAGQEGDEGTHVLHDGPGGIWSD